MAHSFPVNLPEWEDVLCEVYGVGWRSFRDQFRNRHEWMQNFHSFANIICDRWRLPKLVENTNISSSPRDIDRSLKATKRELRLQERPAQHSEEPLVANWAGVSRRFVCCVDCKPLKEVILGQAVALPGSNEKVLSSICENLGDLLQQGWMPPQD